MENIKEEIKYKMKNILLSKLTEIVVFAAVVMGIILCMFVLKSGESDKRGGEVTTISKSTLEKVCEISELSTANYAYNAIATAYDDDQVTIKYRVAYEGTVMAGIDFTRIEISVDDENKSIVIKVPEVEIQSTSVDAGKMKFIFTDDKFETETVTQEAYGICKEDLAKRAVEESDLLAFAKENAVAAVEALVSPWVTQIDSEYQIMIE